MTIDDTIEYVMIALIGFCIFVLADIKKDKR